MRIVAPQADVALIRPVAKKFDTSGKSPVKVQHRKNFQARAGKSVVGFLMQRDISRHCDVKKPASVGRTNPGDPQQIELANSRRRPCATRRRPTKISRKLRTGSDASAPS